MNEAKPENVFERKETIAAWDADYYHPIAERYYDVAIPAMLKAMGARPGDLVLDAGCGPGVHSIRAARYGARVKAIDLSNEMLAEARRRAEKAGLAEKIDFSQGDLTALTLESNAYPFVFSWGVVIHIPGAEKALDNLARVTAPGGKLALQVLGRSSLDWRAERLARGLLSKGHDETETAVGAGLWYDFNDDRLWVQRFDAKKLEAEMQKRGMKLIARRGAEFTEFQWRGPKLLRPLLLLWNRAAYALRLPASLFCTEIFIFRKAA
ncbi:MAG TPA: class I SAM-dependent methyltransferase [Parvularculaceae bacterium]|nr:class I SAM-dependent methyltransferase [Parvularculaceae bacterium]